jgi:predicted lysophospholipase L1 biosynthesis ABC-type transport system permease subunit
MRAFFYTADFAVRGLLRQRAKNGSITALFALIVFLFSGIHFMANALYQETVKAVALQPEIIVQQVKAGRQVPVDLAIEANIADILGVAQVRGRVWGYYFDPFTGANYTIVGDPGDLVEDWQLSLKTEVTAPQEQTLHTLNQGEALVGEGVLKIRRMRVGERLNFRDHEGRPMALSVKGVFSSTVSLWTHDLIVLSEPDTARLFGLQQGTAWDLAVDVPNTDEVPKVGEKITRLLPGARVISKNQLMRTYSSSYGFRSGVLLSTSIICLLAFLILAYDRLARLSREEQREIAILKAIGWQTGDLIRLNMLQSLVLSLTGFLIGILLSYGHVFWAGAPLLRSIFSGWSVLFPPHPLPVSLDLSKLFGLMFLTVVPYIAVGIIPAWRAAVKDPEEVFRA